MIENIRFEKISIDKGLSQSIVNVISQDSIGFLWVGTQDGLNMFNGNKFKVFRKNLLNENCIANNDIHSIFEDSSGNLWIGGERMSLSVLNNKNNIFHNIKLTETNLSHGITSIIEDKFKNIWVASYGNGLYKIKDFKVIQHFKKNESDSIGNNINCNIANVLNYDSDRNLLYIGTWTGGLNILDLNNMKFTHYTVENQNSISDNRIKCIYRDSRDILWVTTHNGMNSFSNESKIFTNYFSNPEDKNSLSENVLMDICEDNEGLLWIATRNNGLNCYNYSEKKFHHFKYDIRDPYSISSNSLVSLFIDKTNNIWIGTWGEGLCKIDRLQKKFYHFKNYYIEDENDRSNKISAITVDREGELWIGTFSNGVFKVNVNSVIQKFIHINRKSISWILENSSGEIYISSQLHGLCSFNKSENKFYIHKHNEIDFEEYRIFQLAQDKKDLNMLWIGTEHHGLLLFNMKEKKYVNSSELPEDLKKLTVHCLFIDNFNRIWLGTHGKGIYVFDPISYKIIENYLYDEFDINSISDNSIWHITNDRNNQIWIATSNGGINKFLSSKNKFERYTLDDGLCNNETFGILADKINNLWISTNYGLSKFDTDKKTFKNFEFRDGLQGNEFNSFAFCQNETGTMYFGGMNGISYFNPEEIKENPNIPNVVFTDFEIFNETINGSPDNPFLKKNITYADEINLTYKESVFSFKFASLIFNNPQKNQYAYKMEGFDKDWTYSGTRRRVTYTNLDPGNYTFKVKGSNNDGVWNEEGTSVKINISPPYWKTWWFKGLGILGAVAATGLTYKQRLDKIEKERKAQEEFSRKLIESQEHERKRIAHELHDTISHEILISKNKAALALKHKDTKGRMEEALKEISEMASSTINDLRSISYNLHPHQLERLGIKKTLLSIINEADKSTNISFSSDIDDIDGLLTMESEINLFRVIQEIISNIIKHSEATIAKFKIKIIGDNIFSLISDNGKGFDVSSKYLPDSKEGIGLNGIAERIKFMGQYRIESEHGKGTVYKIKIPIKFHKNE